MLPLTSIPTEQWTQCMGHFWRKIQQKTATCHPKSAIELKICLPTIQEAQLFKFNRTINLFKAPPKFNWKPNKPQRYNHRVSKTQVPIRRTDPDI